MRFHSNSSLAVGALLLTGIWMIAPAASGAPGRKTQSSQPANIAVDHAGGNGVRRADGGQSAGTSSNPSPSTETQNRKKHLAGVKYQDRTKPGSNAPGMAVNEQGSRGPAQVYKRH